MPVYNLSRQWSDLIPVTVGTIVQNQSGGVIEITPADPSGDSVATLRLPPHGAIQIESGDTESIYARALGDGRNILSVIGGF